MLNSCSSSLSSKDIAHVPDSEPRQGWRPRQSTDERMNNLKLITALMAQAEFNMEMISTLLRIVESTKAGQEPVVMAAIESLYEKNSVCLQAVTAVIEENKPGGLLGR
jgi:hypothetical protein